MSSVTTGSSFYAAVLLVLLLTVTQCGNSKFPNLHCDNVWDEPSAQNDPLTCIMDTDRILAQWRMLAMPALCAFLFVAVLIAFPISCFFTCLCSSRCKPSSKDGGKEQRCCLWMWIMFALIWAFGVAAFVFFGVKQLWATSNHFLDVTLMNPLNVVNCTAEKVIDFASNWTSGNREPYADGVDVSFFYDISENAVRVVEMLRGRAGDYIKLLPVVSYAVGSVCFALMAPMVILACCRRGPLIVPECFACAYFVFGLVFSVGGAVLFLLSYASSSVCGEIALHRERKPGIIQWYGIPLCNSKFRPDAINKKVTDAEIGICREACNYLLDNCDNLDMRGPSMSRFSGSSVSYDGYVPSGYLKDRNGKPNTRSSDISPDAPASFIASGFVSHAAARNVGGTFPVKVLTCGKNITSSDECPNFGITATVLEDTRVKAFVGSCPTPGNSCTVVECAANCTEGRAKNVSIEVVRVAARSRNVSVALSIGRPLLECNFMLDIALTAMPDCEDITPGVFMLSVGFLLGSLMFAVGIYVMLRGSCVWGSAKTSPEAS
ncbi:hypothetical protein DPX39_040050300 [Trypanosoma brucei equiperdum]|uniref:Uncharacterized protein n=1 Tax=Trypanosoma brucei equiperdum TaxID=630700 RepID=A0A3L6LE81_9TRYP|nr:hypothetical protein DPX39_040050300 [Trypanosoma brucei equiperdum]